MDRRQLIPWMLLVGGNLVGFFALPFLLKHSLIWLLFLLPYCLLGYSQFAVVHEGIHGNLHKDASTNRVLGRVAGVAFGSPFSFLRLAHLLHHKHNRAVGHPELEETWSGPRWWATVQYYLELGQGLYLKEFVVSLLCLAPTQLWEPRCKPGEKSPINDLLLSALAKPRVLHAARVDGAIIVGVHLVALLMYENHWWAFVAMFCGRALAVSFHDNAYHYDTPISDVLYARDLKLSSWLEPLMLNFNYHGVHHRSPGLPWYCLKGEFKATDGTFAGGFFQANLDQTKGLIPRNRAGGSQLGTNERSESQSPTMSHAASVRYQSMDRLSPSSSSIRG